MVRTSTEGKAKRITIMVDNDLDKKVRLRQARLIQTDQKTHSYSSVINELIRKALR